MRIGGDYAGANEFAGYVDELRISNTNRYTAAFTPKNGMFQGDANTKMLLHFDGVEGFSSTLVTGLAPKDLLKVKNLIMMQFLQHLELLVLLLDSLVSLKDTMMQQILLNSINSLLQKKQFMHQPVQYPSLVIPGGNVNCEDDVRDILSALIEDLRNGFNSHMWMLLHFMLIELLIRLRLVM